jgi:hypothetical protein
LGWVASHLLFSFSQAPRRSRSEAKISQKFL